MGGGAVRGRGVGGGRRGKDVSQSQVEEFISEAESLCLKNTTSGEKGVKKHTQTVQLMPNINVKI